MQNKTTSTFWIALNAVLIIANIVYFMKFGNWINLIVLPLPIAIMWRSIQDWKRS